MRCMTICKAIDLVEDVVSFFENLTAGEENCQDAVTCKRGMMLVVSAWVDPGHLTVIPVDLEDVAIDLRAKLVRDRLEVLGRH